MCNHYRIEDGQRVLDFARTKSDVTEGKWEVKDHAWPQYNMPLIYRRESERALTSMRWGVWPMYERGAKPKGGFITNARDDKLLTSVVWRDSIRKRRCIVPADAWLEWAGPPGAKWEVQIRFSDARPFWIAGLWSPDPVGGSRGFALVTTAPNELVASIPHNRMIVLLDDQKADSWMSGEAVSDDDLLSMCRPYHAQDLVRLDLPKAAKLLKNANNLLG